MYKFPAVTVAVILLFGPSAVSAAEHQETKDRRKTEVSEAADTPSTQKTVNEREKKNDRNREVSREQDGADDGADSAAGGRGSDSRAGRGKSASGETGGERSEAMRARRDERKVIQEEYRSDRKPGQEGRDEEEGKPAKKSWWKFWGD